MSKATVQMKIPKEIREYIAQLSLDEAPELKPNFDGKNIIIEDIEKHIDYINKIFQQISVFSFFYSKADKIDAPEGEFMKTLMNDGLVIIPNFLSAECSKAIQQYFLEIEASHNSSSSSIHQSQENNEPILINHINHVFASCRIKELYIYARAKWLAEFKAKLGPIYTKLTGLDITLTNQFTPQSWAMHGDKEDILFDRNTSWHIDRFYPVYKCFYFPFASNVSKAPFGYAKQSHIINRDYKIQVARAIFNSRKNNQMIGWNTDFKYEKIEHSENCLIIAATNGLHRRSLFEGQGFRHSLRILPYQTGTLRNYISLIR